VPRGPHLPDVVMAIPRVALAFILLAAARLAVAVDRADLGMVPQLTTILAYAMGSIAPVVAVLLPAALLIRHPEAARRARTLLAGTVLIAAGELLRALADPLQPVFEQLTPPNAEVGFLIPMAIGYSALVSLVGTFGVANVGLGLARARRYEDRSGTRAIALALALVALLLSAIRIVEVARLPYDQIPITPAVVAYLGTTVILGILAAVAWTYLAATALRGARAGEEPRSGWVSGALGICFVVVALVVGAGLSLAVALNPPTPDAQPAFTAVGHVMSGVVALGYFLLLAGLAAGLPSLDETARDGEVPASPPR
jgi:hypothetical protein